MGKFKEAISRAFSYSNNSLDVIVGDQTTPPVDIYFSQDQGDAVNLATDATINTNTITVTDATDFSVGDICTIISTSGNFYQGGVLGISTNTLTLDTPLNYAYTTAESEAYPSSREMNINGAVTPQVFKIRGESGTIDVPITFDITRIMLQMVTTNPAEYGKFGDITGGLTNGIVLRQTNGEINNFWNAKFNEDLGLLAYDILVFDATKPSGVNGLGMRYSFAGASKHGVAVRLSPDQSIDLIVQDDLSSLVSFRMMAQGHIVD